MIISNLFYKYFLIQLLILHQIDLFNLDICLKILRKSPKYLVNSLTLDEKYLHLEALPYNFLGNIIEFDRTWTQFILNAIIPTLLGRLNHRISSDFINRIVSIKRSTSLSTANFKEYRNNQPLTTIINNVLRKLTQTIENKNKPIKDQYTKLKKRIK